MQEILWKAEEGHRFETFLGMSDEQAQSFFDEYLRARDDRLKALKTYFQETGGGDETDLNFTPESLIRLWSWAKQHLHRREFTSRERERIANMPDVLRNDSLFTTPPLSEESLKLVNDMAYYFADVLIERLKGVYWKICKAKLKRYGDDNQPVLGGFSPTPINPRTWVKSIADDTVDGNVGDDALYNAYLEAFDRVGPEGRY